MAIKEEATNRGLLISPREIMTDFELALVQSLALEFPGTQIHGCYFHFAQCLWRKDYLTHTTYTVVGRH